MMNRKVAILLFDERRLSEVKNTVSILMDNQICSEITVFSKNIISEFNIQNNFVCCKNEIFPECEKNELEPSKRNAVLKKYENEGFNGILHVISDNVQLIKNPLTFMNDLESMMYQFDYPLWLSTVTDPCNYIYGKYNPHCIIKNDIQALKDNNINYGFVITSHSNTSWMAYDLKKLQEQKNIEYFSEEFSISMFYIIELLARRRTLKTSNQMFYMNQYLTVDSEIGVFKLAEELPSIEEPTQETMRNEDLKFKSMNVKYEPDINVDVVIDSITEKILQKTQNKIN